MNHWWARGQPALGPRLGVQGLRPIPVAFHSGQVEVGMQRRFSVAASRFLAWLRYLWRGQGRTVEKRQWPRYPSHVRTWYQPADSPDRPKQPAQVQNISQGGIRMLLPEPWPSGTLLHIELPRPEPQGSPNLLACVVHSVFESGRNCAVGCS